MNDAIPRSLLGVSVVSRLNAPCSLNVLLRRSFTSGGKMTIVFVVLLFLSSLQLSDGVTCVTNALYPCKCTLSDGASGVVDISPLFSQGNLTAIDK